MHSQPSVKGIFFISPFFLSHVSSGDIWSLDVCNQLVLKYYVDVFFLGWQFYFAFFIMRWLIRVQIAYISTSDKPIYERLWCVSGGLDPFNRYIWYHIGKIQISALHKIPGCKLRNIVYHLSLNLSRYMDFILFLVFQLRS